MKVLVHRRNVTKIPSRNQVKLRAIELRMFRPFYGLKGSGSCTPSPAVRKHDCKLERKMGLTLGLK